MKYLFTAYYNDGTSYKQTPEDVSVTGPPKSCYFDVKEEEVSKFELTDGKNIYLVDLSDGHFEINNVPFYLHDKAMLLTDMRLYYFRKHDVSIQIGAGTKSKQKDEIMFQFGWEAKNNGEDIKRIIEIE